MSTLEALIFDVDGTLADTERDGHRVAFNQAFDEYNVGWNWDVETYGKLLAVTGGKERMRYYYDNFPDAQKLSSDYTSRLDELIPELHQAKTRHYTKLLSTGTIPLRQGVERLLREAHERGLRLAIATTSTPASVTTLLTHTLGEDSIGWFDVIAAGDVVAAKKPAGDIYDYALKAMKLAPEQCLAFEDSHNGILSSHEAGLKTVVTVNGYTRDHDFTGALLVLDHMGEPDQPFNVLSGDTGNHTMLDVDLLFELHRRA